MDRLCIWVALVAGGVLCVRGVYGLFIPRLTSDDGALAIAGAVLVAGGLVAGARK